MTPEVPTHTRSGMTQHSVRASNLAEVLHAIRDGDGPSRADIAAYLGMTRSTVSRLVDDLVTGGLVREGTAVGGARGRPATPLSLRSESVIALGYEINLDRVVACAVDLDGEPLVVRHLPWAAVDEGPEASMARISEFTDDLLTHISSSARVVGAGLAVPALIDRDGRSLLRAPNLGWDGAVPARWWQLTVGGHRVPLKVLNSSHSTALTVLRDADEASFVFVHGDIGVGGAIALDGALLSGHHGWASEVGHICVEPHGPRCACGASGCLETVVGLRHFLDAAGQATIDGVVAALDAEEPRAMAAVDRVAEALGIALSAALNLLDVTTVGLGGYLATLHPWLRLPLSGEIGDRVLWARHSGIDFTAISDSPARAATGAGLAALDTVLADPAGWVDGMCLSGRT